MNDQRVFQEISGKPEAIEQMEKVQAKFDAGMSFQETYWADDD